MSQNSAHGKGLPFSHVYPSQHFGPPPLEFEVPVEKLGADLDVRHKRYLRKTTLKCIELKNIPARLGEDANYGELYV